MTSNPKLSESPRVFWASDRSAEVSLVNDDEDEHAPIYNNFSSVNDTTVRQLSSTSSWVGGHNLEGRTYDENHYQLSNSQMEASPSQTSWPLTSNLLPPHLRGSSSTICFENNDSVSFGSPTFVAVNNNMHVSLMSTAVHATPRPSVDNNDVRPQLSNFGCFDADLTLGACSSASVNLLTGGKNVFDVNMLEQVSSTNKNLITLLGHVTQECHEAANSAAKYSLLTPIHESISCAIADGELMQTCLMMKDFYETKLAEQDAYVKRLKLRCDDFEVTAKTLEKEVLNLNEQLAQLEVENQTLRMQEDFYKLSEAQNKQDITLLQSNDQLGLELGFEPLLTASQAESSRGLNIVSEYKSEINSKRVGDEAALNGRRGRWPNLRRATLAIVPGLEEKFAARRRTMGLTLDGDVIQPQSNVRPNGTPKTPLHVAVETEPMQLHVQKSVLKSPFPNDIDDSVTKNQVADKNDRANDHVADSVSFGRNADDTKSCAKFSSSPKRAVIDKTPTTRQLLSNALVVGITTDTSLRRDSGRLRVSSSNGPRWWSGGAFLPPLQTSLSPHASTSSGSLLSTGSVGGTTGNLSMIDEQSESDASNLSVAKRFSSTTAENLQNSSRQSFKINLGHDSKNNISDNSTLFEEDVRAFAQIRQKSAEKSSFIEDDAEKSRTSTATENVAGAAGGDASSVRSSIKMKPPSVNPFDDLCANLGGLNIADSTGCSSNTGTPTSEFAAAAARDYAVNNNTDGDLISLLPSPAGKKTIFSNNQPEQSCYMPRQQLFAHAVYEQHPLSPIAELKPVDNEKIISARNSDATSAVVEKELVVFRTKLNFVDAWFVQVVKILKAEQQLHATMHQQQPETEMTYKIRWAKLRKIIESLSTHPTTIDSLRDEIKRQKRQILKLENDKPLSSAVQKPSL